MAIAKLRRSAPDHVSQDKDAPSKPGIKHGAGFDRIETVSSCRAAEEWLTANDPDLVVMDIELTDGLAGAIARSLRGRRIPFIVYTGAQRKIHPDALSFSEGVWLEKPWSGIS